MAKKKPDTDGRPTILNRRARFEYELVETFVAGIELRGTEVKSTREGKVQLQEAFCAFKGEELYLLNAHIKPYSHGGAYNHELDRPRRLLLKRKELEKLKAGVGQKGLTIVPLKLFFNARNLLKLELALARGKKTHDKRQTIKDRDQKRDLDRKLAE